MLHKLSISNCSVLFGVATSMQSTIKVSVIHTMLPSNSRPCSFRKTLASSMEVILDSTGSSFSAIFFGHGGPTLLPPFPTRDESRVPSGLPFNFVLDILLFGNDVCVISQKRTEDIATTICYCKQSLHPPKCIWGPTRCHMVTNQESSLLVACIKRTWQEEGHQGCTHQMS